MSLAIKAARVSSVYGTRGYAGDPGLFGSILGGVKGAVGSVLKGGNPLSGAISGAVSGWSGGGGQAPPRGIPSSFPAPSTLSAPMARPPAAMPGLSAPVTAARRLAGGSVTTAAKGLGAVGALISPKGPRGMSGAQQVAMANASMNGMGCPRGYHPNKSEYFLKDGTFVPKGSRCVRNRRRNSLNPRALSKAIGRVEGFKKAAKRAGHITVRKRKC